jgi:shikimate kinase
MDAGSRSVLLADDAVVIWLRADPAILLGRVRYGDHRPCSMTIRPGCWSVERRAGRAYDEVSDVIMDDLDLDEVAACALQA